MPDFDTRKPQEPDGPRRHRIASTANKLRALLVGARSRVPSIANRVRSLWSATTLRALLVGGGVLFFVAVAVAVGLLIYPSGGKGNQQVAEDHSSGGIGDQQWEAKNADLEPLAACSSNRSGRDGEVRDGDSSAKKIVFASGPQTTAGSSGTMSDNPGHPNTGMFVINADGSGLTQLTGTTAAEFGIPDSLLLNDSELEHLFTYGTTNVVGGQESVDQTVCSPDGKKLASVTTTAPEATDSDSSAPPEDTDISVRTSAGTANLGDPGYDYSVESSPVFSLDSRKLAFTKSEQIYVANADGSDQTQLANNEMRYTAGPVFSPDSEKVAFQTDTPGGPDSTDLYVVDVDDTNLTRLTHNTKRFGKGYSIQEHMADGGVLISPDSKKIAFVIYRIKYTPPEYPDPKLQVRYDMYVVNVDGTGLTRLTYTEALEEKAVAWAGR